MADTTQGPQHTHPGHEEEPDQDKKDQKMCCEGGMTAEEHRSKSPDGKCCTD